jgi:hypothetical protein
VNIAAISPTAITPPTRRRARCAKALKTAS